MENLDSRSRMCEQSFGLISGSMILGLWQISVDAGSKWDYDKPETMEIIVTKENADAIYAYCKEIRSNGYSIGVNASGMKKIKAARMEAHQILFEEANDPKTSIERKIELVKLTSRQ